MRQVSASLAALVGSNLSSRVGFRSLGYSGYHAEDYLKGREVSLRADATEDMDGRDIVAELFAGNVEVQYGQAYIELNGQFDGAMDDCFRGQNNGLCGAQSPAILFLVTGLHTGPVGMTINLFEADPGIDTGWDEIVEVSFQAPRGEIVLIEWAADEGVRMAVLAGSYRARYHGLAMQAASDLDTNIEEIPVDIYRLDLWPAPPAPDRVVKQTSAVAAYWHDNARNLSAEG